MTPSDPVEIFRQESGELLDTLELGLLDLATRPDDMDLVDGVFRALHTLKGSGAMFGFTAAAAFLHDFETAFDQVRKGEAPASPQLITVALAARDHIATLCSDPQITDPGGADILADLRRAIGEAAPAAAEAAAGTPPPLPEAPGDGWLIRFRLPPDALVYGTNPILLLEEMAGLGRIEVSALLADVPPLEAIDPDTCRLGWTVRLHTDQPREAIDDVFMFLHDGMELAVEPLEAAEAAAARRLRCGSRFRGRRRSRTAARRP